MRLRSVAALGFVLGAACLANGQPRTAAPQPPDKATLDRLHLRSEWAVNIPMDGNRDAVTLIQTLGDQLFIQTRTGRLIAMDAASGHLQWSTTLGSGQFTNTYPVAVNSRFVFAANVTTLHAFHRYSGLTEFVTEMGTMPTAGLTADENTLFAVLATRPGYAGASRVEAYRLPRPISIHAATAEKSGSDAASAAFRGNPPPNPVDTLMKRYPSSGAPKLDPQTDIAPNRKVGLRTVPAGGYSGTPTPSLTVVPTVNPPYVRESGVGTPSIGIMPSLLPPYRLTGSGSRVQQSASLVSIPPSVAAALALSDFKPKSIQPEKVLEVGLMSRILYPILLTPLRAWAATDNDTIVAVSTRSRTTEVVQKTSDRVAATPAQAYDMGYFPIADGNLLAIDLTTGNLTGGANVIWRATVGGLMNHPPLATRDAIFVSGEDSGVARVDRTTGYVLWKSENAADRVLAANDDFVYIHNQQGRLLLYDARKTSDPNQGRMRPLTGIDLPAFNLPVMNTVTDRLYLAADSGLIVCLRDAAAKYSKPVRMAPLPPPPPPPPAAAPAPKTEGDAAPPTTPPAPAASEALKEKKE